MERPKILDAFEYIELNIREHNSLYDNVVKCGFSDMAISDVNAVRIIRQMIQAADYLVEDSGLSKINTEKYDIGISFNIKSGCYIAVSAADGVWSETIENMVGNACIVTDTADGGSLFNSFLSHSGNRVHMAQIAVMERRRLLNALKLAALCGY